MSEMRIREEMIAEMKGKTIPAVEVRRFIAEILMTEKIKDPYPNLLCQDMEKKLARWFESRLDAREVFRRNLLSDSKKGKA